MKCKKCGSDFDGNFCPSCGAPSKPNLMKLILSFSKSTLILWGCALAMCLYALITFDSSPLCLALVLLVVGFFMRHPKTPQKPIATAPSKDVVPEKRDYAEKSSFDCTSSTEYDYFRFRVAGVTFKNGRKHRQTILRAIKYHDGEFANTVTVTAVPYKFNDDDAIGIYANGQQVGNVPATDVPAVMEKWASYHDVCDFAVYGGGRTDDNSPRSFGMGVTLQFNK